MISTLQAEVSWSPYVSEHRAINKTLLARQLISYLAVKSKLTQEKEYCVTKILFKK